MPKKIFTQELEGTRRRGRPRKRWKEEVEGDLQVLGVRRWRDLVADREKMALFDRPKPTVGFSTNKRRRRRRRRRSCAFSWNKKQKYFLCSMFPWQTAIQISHNNVIKHSPNLFSSQFIYARYFYLSSSIQNNLNFQHFQRTDQLS